MSTGPKTMAERHGRMLAEAAGIMLAAMQRLAERLDAAESPEAARDAGLSLSRVNRGLRQTILLEAKLARDEADDKRRRDKHAQAARKTEAKETAAQLRMRARGVILETCDSREAADPLLDDVELWAEDYVAGAAGAPLEELVIRLCRDAGVIFPAHELPPALRPQAGPAPASPPNSS